MRYKDLLVEKYSRDKNVIAVDIQPAYTIDSHHYNTSVMEFLNDMNGEILMLANADQDGLTEDTKDDIYGFWYDNGFDEDRFDDVTYIDKGYGYLRSWMDNDVPEHIIIKTIREMYRQKVYDSRDLFGGDANDEFENQFVEFVGEDVFDESMLYEPLIVEWLSIKMLKRFSGSYVIGGGRNECLREVTLLMNAFNIRYKLIDHLIYG